MKDTSHMLYVGSVVDLERGTLAKLTVARLQADPLLPACQVTLELFSAYGVERAPRISSDVPRYLLGLLELAPQYAAVMDPTETGRKKLTELLQTLIIAATRKIT